MGKDRKEAEKALNEKKERIRKAKEAREAAAKEAAENPQLLAGVNLVRADGSPGTIHPSCQLLLLCSLVPPVQAVYPDPSRLLPRSEDQGVEIIFVSSDRSASEMASYMRESHGPWLAVSHGSPAIARMSQEFGFEGIPFLVVLTSQGRLVTKQGRQDVTSMAPAKCVQKRKSQI